MRTLLYIPVVMVGATALAAGTCAVLHWNGYTREMLMAALICMLGAEIALVPSVWLRRANAEMISQAGLVGTVLDMFFTIALAAMVFFLALVPNRQPFLFWILGFYWISLLTLVFSLSQLVRNAKA